MTVAQFAWLERLNDDLSRYLQTLESPDLPGRFLPCLAGATQAGKQAALGFSCFALKVYYTLGLWQGLQSQTQLAWKAFLQSFQVVGPQPGLGGRVSHNAFIDPAVVEYLASRTAWRQELAARILRPRHLTHVQKVIIAETKQAIATLAQVGESAAQPYYGLPMTPMGIRKHLTGLDWAKPWGAGGQASALVVIVKTEAPRLLGYAGAQELLDTCALLFERLADAETGGYFKGGTPEHSQLINGAMKVLTALDWLEVPIHYSERLIDTCLERLPSPDGCHLVDAIYVLYRCLQQTHYRWAEVQDYCEQVLDMIKQHHRPDGGFSYYVGHSQTHYYGVHISEGLGESDIHGTCLLAWAIAMILEILENNRFDWRVIRP